MKTLYVVLFKVWECNHLYTSLSSYYFKTQKDALSYARRFVESSTTFTDYEIKDVMLHIV